MNIEISILLNFDGDKTVVESLLSDLADVLVNHGFANSENKEDNIVSLLMMQPIEDFDLDQEMERSFYVIVPTLGEDESV